MQVAKRAFSPLREILLSYEYMLENDVLLADAMKALLPLMLCTGTVSNHCLTIIVMIAGCNARHASCPLLRYS